MKILIQHGGMTYKVDDGMGEASDLGDALHLINKLAHALYPEEMIGQRVVSMDDEMAESIFGEDIPECTCDQSCGCPGCKADEEEEQNGKSKKEGHQPPESKN
jgi:hypothetical protein